jgi:cell division septation protein DedD
VKSLVPSRRRSRITALATAAVIMSVAAVVIITPADAATLLSADFQSGANGWSKAGGDWSVVKDGSDVLQQTNTGTAKAREFAGSTKWANYSLQARVKPLVFGSGGVVALASRAAGAAKMYRLALTGANRVELQYMDGSNTTVLASASRAVSTGSWYTLRLDAYGSTIAGYVNGSLIGTATTTAITAGRVGLFTGFASARFDDITVTDSTTTTPPTTTPPTHAPPTTTPPTHAAPTTTPSTDAASTTTPPTTAPPTTAPTSTPPTTAPSVGMLYVSPKGSASAAGTKSDPTTLASAIDRVSPGGTISLRGGTYNLSETVTIAPGNDGTSSARKGLFAYPGETPVLNFSAMSEDPANRGLAVNGSFWHICGIAVEHAGDNGIFVGGSNNIIERTVTAFNRDSGLQISRILSTTPRDEWPSNNLILSSESHDNVDSGGENADGFAAKLTSGPGNVFRYDVSHNNIDDGWDLFAKPATGPIDPVTIEHSLAFDNGTLSDGTQNEAGDRNGYKLGGSSIAVQHIVRHNIAYKNGHHGFTYNSNPGPISVSTNVSVDNAERNFAFDVGTSVFRNNTSCRSSSGSEDKVVGDADSSNQFWSGTNGSRCAPYAGALGWSFAADGHLVVTFGGKSVTP